MGYSWRMTGYIFIMENNVIVLKSALLLLRNGCGKPITTAGNANIQDRVVAARSELLTDIIKMAAAIFKMAAIIQSTARFRRPILCKRSSNS